MARVLSLLLVLTACGSSTGTDDPDETDTDADTNSEDGPHPLAPEEFQLLWNTEGSCSTEFGDGDQIYMIGEGRLETDGSLVFTETVYWFFADEPRSADCKDVWTITGTELNGDPESLGYAGGEHFYDVRREISDAGCTSGTKYGSVYREDDDGYYQRLMFDLLNEFNDAPNEKPAVFHEERNFFGQGYVTKLYASEPGSKLTPDDGSTHAPPAEIRWIGKRCVVARRGGGGG